MEYVAIIVLVASVLIWAGMDTKTGNNIQRRTGEWWRTTRKRFKDWRH